MFDKHQLNPDFLMNSEYHIILAELITDNSFDSNPAKAQKTISNAIKFAMRNNENLKSLRAALLERLSGYTTIDKVPATLLILLRHISAARLQDLKYIDQTSAAVKAEFQKPIANEIKISSEDQFIRQLTDNPALLIQLLKFLQSQGYIPDSNLIRIDPIRFNNFNFEYSNQLVRTPEYYLHPDFVDRSIRGYEDKFQPKDIFYPIIPKQYPKDNNPIDYIDPDLQ
jgi:hypothetical protein